MKIQLPTHWYNWVKSIEDPKERALTAEALFVFDESQDLTQVNNNSMVHAFVEGYIAAMDYHEMKPILSHPHNIKQ